MSEISNVPLRSTLVLCSLRLRGWKLGDAARAAGVDPLRGRRLWWDVCHRPGGVEAMLGRWRDRVPVLPLMEEPVCEPVELDDTAARFVDIVRKPYEERTVREEITVQAVYEDGK